MVSSSIIYMYVLSQTPHHCAQAPDERLLFSYNHLLFRPTVVRFPPLGLGDPGSENRLVAVLVENGLPPPKDDLRPPASPLLLLENRGLPVGE